MIHVCTANMEMIWESDGNQMGERIMINHFGVWSGIVHTETAPKPCCRFGAIWWHAPCENISHCGQSPAWWGGFLTWCYFLWEATCRTLGYSIMMLSPNSGIVCGHPNCTSTWPCEKMSILGDRLQQLSWSGIWHILLVGGIPTPLKNMSSSVGMKVSWDDEIPNIWKNKIHVPNHQPGIDISTTIVKFDLFARTNLTWTAHWGTTNLYNISHRIHGAGIYANIKGIYWWDPWHTIYSSTMDPSWVWNNPLELLQFLTMGCSSSCGGTCLWMLLHTQFLGPADHPRHLGSTADGKLFFVVFSPHGQWMLLHQRGFVIICIYTYPKCI